VNYEPTIQADEELSFEARLRAVWPVAQRVATVVLGTADGADDVVQIAMERAWRARRTYDSARPFVPWLLRIVTNTARNDRRRRGRQAALRRRAAGQAVLHAATPEDDAVTEDDRRAVLAALNRLEIDDRTVLALRYIEQLSEAEVAAVIDCPLGTVKSRLSRAKGRLRAHLVVSEPGS
jgi:RNA polymerase sigma-70 factor (ECF subfamily)